MTGLLSCYAVEEDSASAATGFAGITTGGCGLVSSDPLLLWQQTQPTQH